MYSEVSQNCVVGASVNTYSTRAPRATRPAQRYGGRSASTYGVCGSVMLARLGSVVDGAPAGGRVCRVGQDRIPQRDRPLGARRIAVTERRGNRVVREDI